jgi:hypothetical protein
VHDSLHIVSDALSRSDSQMIELLELAIAGRIGHWVPVEGSVGLIRSKRNNKPFSSKYEGHQILLFLRFDSKTEPLLLPITTSFGT